MKLYRVTLKHDNGTAEVIVSAESIQDAKTRIMEIENCPESAVVSIWRHITGGQKKSATAKRISGRKTIAAFIKEHRDELDEAIKKRLPNAKLNDGERRKWILNDEGLYQWARSEGVKI